MINTLWELCRDLVLKLGSWLIEKLVELGIAALIRLLKRGIKRLKRKRKRFKDKAARAQGARKQRRYFRRVSWLSWRLDNWNKALKWAEDRQMELNEKVAGELKEQMDKAAEHYPKVAPDEVFALWDKMGLATE